MKRTEVIGNKVVSLPAVLFIATSYLISKTMCRDYPSADGLFAL
jgi:hypothetical protein